MAGNGNQMGPLGETSDFSLKYSGNGTDGAKAKSFTITNGGKTLSSNLLFNRSDLKKNIFEKFSRYGYIDPYNQDDVVREFLFFTKPDLYISEASTSANFNVSNLNENLYNVPLFRDAVSRHPDAIMQLQSSVKDSANVSNPFMYLLSNSVTSKLDLPSISAESQESTSNLFGTSIQYRSHSLKSDSGYDFNLSFVDGASLELYTMVKVYDEYMRRLRTGETAPKKEYIVNHILPEEFSIYKFLIGSDGETILYYAKLTGVHFTDVPRSDFGDPSSPFKFSLGFHAQFVEDNDPIIITEFNTVAGNNGYTDYIDVYDYDNNVVNNEFVKFPKIVLYSGGDGDIRAKRHYTNYDYRLKWVNR